jgi:hypothetical protein
MVSFCKRLRSATVIDENVAIREKQDARLAMLTSSVPAARPELPANLKGHDGLSRSRRHGEKQARLSGKNGFNRPVNGDLLIIPGRLAADRIIGGNQMLQAFGRVDPATGLVATPKLVRCGKIDNAGFRTLEIVDLDYLGSVGGVSVFQPKNFGIVPRLLDGIGRGLIGCLRFNYGQWEIPRISQQVINTFWRLADETFAHGDNAPIGNGALLGD